MDQLPSDPAILLSYLNMKLRDRYATADELCSDMDIDPDDLNAYLASRGISYLPEGKRFVLD